ncbi:hypothetical protein [Burkholderia sp. AU45388]|uniref:hypothetical protein n=1 Tax=Burkholderia sp. AU45388 TaxID=3059206 RepID=UPI00265861F9|nr:hypothetical protein [Burkholderia sp. AU45388]
MNEIIEGLLDYSERSAGQAVLSSSRRGSGDPRRTQCSRCSEEESRHVDSTARNSPAASAVHAGNCHRDRFCNVNVETWNEMRTQGDDFLLFRRQGGVPAEVVVERRFNIFV